MKLGIRHALVFAIVAAGGCSKNDAPTGARVGGDRAPFLMAFMSERPPAQTFSPDLYFYDLSTGGPAYRPRNLDTPSIEGPGGLSADGQHLAFLTNRQPVGSSAFVLIYDVATGVTRVPHWINTLLSPLNPALSGDGRYLAVQYQVSGLFDSWVAVEDMVGDSLLPVSNLNFPGALNFDPALSGDAQFVAFASDRPASLGFYDIFLYSVPGDSIVPVPGLNSAASDLAPSLSSDGRYVAFQSGRAGGAGLIDVYLYDRQTRSLIPLPGANTPMADYLPAISPDGRYLAYATESEGGRDIRVYDVQAQRLLDLPNLNDPYFYDYFPTLANR